MEKTFWLTFDLGLRGDYPGLYKWLDMLQAKECGNNVAVFRYDSTTQQPEREIESSLRENVNFNPTDRIYLIWRDDETNKNSGTFIIGRRKTAPWEGHSLAREQAIDS
jgi:hypothetical protein